MFVLVLAVVAALALGFGWRAWQSRLAEQQQAEDTRAQRWMAMEQTLEALRRDQRAANQRLQDAAATNRILRDEMLGLSQRGALLEETVERLADTERHGAQALRLDEVELLLNQGQQRLALAGDLDGARRAYALAAGALQGIDDPAYLNLRQTLVQERNALDALGAGPQHVLGAQLDAFISRLQRLPQHVQGEDDAARPWWQRALSPLVQIRPARHVDRRFRTPRRAGRLADRGEPGARCPGTRRCRRFFAGAAAPGQLAGAAMAGLARLADTAQGPGRSRQGAAAPGHARTWVHPAPIAGHA